MTRRGIILVLIVALCVLWQLSANAQAQSTEELKALYSQLDQLCSQGEYTEAILVAEKIRSLTEKIYGPDHVETAAVLSRLAELYRLTGQYTKAEPLCKRSLEIYETKLGKNHLEVAKSLNNIAVLYRFTGRYAEAEPLYNRALQIREEALGKDHPDVATSLNNLAVLYWATGRYAEAEPLYRRALEIYEVKLGKDHPSLAAPLDNLAGLYEDAGRYAEAEPLYNRALQIREEALGKDHPDVATSLNNLAGLYCTTGRYAEAEPLYNRALQIREEALGKEHPELATCLDSLAGLYCTTGRYAEAEPLFQRALQMREKALGKEHPDVAKSLNNLAGLYYATDRYAEAEPLYNRALQISEEALGKEHLEVATFLNNLAEVYRTTGRYAEAESLCKRALVITEARLGKDHPSVARSLNNLALLYHDTGQYAEEEPLYKRALEITEARLGKDHVDVATYLNNIAALYAGTGRYAEAEPLYNRALQIREEALGKDHPDVATSLNNLAVLYKDTGRYAEAEPLYRRALEIYEVKLGKDHPDVAGLLNNLAFLYAAREEYSLSSHFFFKSTSIEEQVREHVFLILDERKKLFFMAENVGAMDALLALAAIHLSRDSRVLEDALTAWLRWKGSVTEAQSRITEACSRSEDPVVIQKCEELTNVRRTLASLTASKPEKMDFETYRKTLAEYEGKKSTLEAELSRLSADFALEKLVGKADIQSISALLPKESAYLDFAVITPYDFQQKRFEEKTRCLVFVLLPGDPPRVSLLDLGDAEAIDQQIREYHKIIQKAVGRKRPPDIDALRQPLKVLYGLVLEPLLPYLQERKQLFISPDGSLNLIPFEALITPEGKYLLQQVSIQYIAAGRDIVRFQDQAQAQGKALILADPDYDLGEQERIEVAKQMGVSEFEIRGSSSRDAGTLTFPRLPDTRKEAEAIEKTLKPGEATCHQGQEAIQEVLYAAQSPKILHIATHGYFLPDQKIAPQWNPGRETLPSEALKSYENPMLRSGIALAGANTSQRQGKDYGMVSAEKILGLHLKGTDLVVLSACETGVGEVQTGEGVFGLKRAFLLSGAKTVVMSLWSVPSRETTKMMGSFYEKWSKGQTKAEALREAKLELMKENPNPFFWGAFVMVGDPGK